MRLTRTMLVAATLMGLLLSCSLASGKSACQTKNWNHGTQQTMTVELPDGSTTSGVIISVKNLDDNEYQGTCPSSGLPAPSVETYEQRKCSPAKFADMTTEWVNDKDEGDKHTLSIEIKNGNEAPPRQVKLCVKYTN
jgi:hypothetical protein